MEQNSMDSKTDRKTPYTLPLTTAQRLALLDRVKVILSDSRYSDFGMLFIDRQDALDTLHLLLEDLQSNRPRLYTGQTALALSSRL